MQSKLQQAILGEIPSGVKLFRNPSGTFRTREGGYVRVGLGRGASDMIGWIEIGGSAIFFAVELKGELEYLKSHQKEFLIEVAESGGYGAVVRSIEDFREIVSGARRGTVAYMKPKKKEWLEYGISCS